MINPQKAIKWYKSTYGDSNQSDYDIYEYLKKKYNKFDYPENPYQNLQEEKKPNYEEQDPSIWRKLLTYNIADNFAEDNQWAQQAYNKSTAGTIYEIMNGKKKYENAGEAEDWWDEVGQFFVGLASPVDVVSFFGSGAIGSAAAKTIGKSTLKKWALKGSTEMMKKQAAKKGISQQFHKYLAREAGLESGLSLGMLGATHGTLAETAKQSSEISKGQRESFNPWEISYAAAKHGASNIALGSVAGYYTKGLMAPKFAKASASQSKSFSNKLTRMTMNPVGQVAAEASVFTTGQVLEQAIAGQPVSIDDFLSGFFMNTGIVGGMRLATAPLRIGQSDLTRYEKAKKTFYGELYEPINTAKALKKAARKLEKTEYQAQKESLESVKNSLEESGISTEAIVEKIASLDLEKISTLDGIRDFKKLLGDYNNLTNKLENRKASDLSKESQSNLIKEIGGIQSILHSVYSDMKNNKELAYEAFKDQIKTDKDKILVDKMIENKLSNIEKSHEVMNLIMNGDKNSISKLKESYGEGFKYNVSEKNGKFELSFEGNDGQKYNVGKFNSKELANKAGESIIDKTKEVITKEESISTQEGQISYTPVTPEGKPMLDNTGKPIVRFAPKSEVDVMLSNKQATKPGVNISDVNQSGKELNANILGQVVEQAVKPLKQQIDIITPATEGMPMNRPTFEAKLQQSQKVLNKETPITTLSTPEREFSITHVRGTRSKIVKESLKDMNEIDKVAFVDFAVDYISKNKSDKNAIVNEVAKFMVHLKELNKDITKISMEDVGRYFDKYNTKPSTIRANSMVQLSNFLLKNEYVKGSVGTELREFARAKFNEFNEYTAEGKNAARVGIRKAVIEKSIKTKKEGVEVAAKLGARYYIRNQELNRLAKFVTNSEKLEKVLKFDKETGEYYLDLKMTKTGDSPHIAKPRTFNRFVWIDKELAMQMTKIVAEGKFISESAKINSLAKLFGSDNTNPFYDLRRRGKESANKLSYSETSTLDFMMGHNRNRLDAIYKNIKPKDVINLQKELHKKLNSPIPKESQKEFLRLNEIKGDTSKEIQYSHRKALGAKYPELVIDLVKDFKDKSIPKDAVAYLEKLENWTVKVKMGKAPSDAIPHEISHYMFKVMDGLQKHFKMRDLPKQEQKTLRLINEAKKIFVDKDGKFNEESAVTMIGKAIDGQLQKPMLARAKSFFKRLNVFFKQLFNKPLNKDEIAYILGTKIVQRKGIPQIKGLSTGREYLKKMELPTKKFLNVVSRDTRIAARGMGIKDAELIKFVAEEIGIKNPDKFRLSLPKDEVSDAYINKKEQIVEFYNAFESFNLNKFTSKKNALQKLKLIREIDSSNIVDFQSPQAQYSRIVKGITPEGQSKLLKNVFGVEDGKLFSADISQLKSYKDYIYQLKAVERDNMTWVTKEELNKFVNLETAKTSTKIFTEGLFLMGEVGDAVKNAGFKKLGYLMNKHYSLEQGNQAPLQFYEKNVKVILGGLPGTRESKLRKVNDYMWTFDNRGEQLLAQQKFMKQNIPDKAHFRQSEKFFRKAIKEEWWSTVKEGKNKLSRGADLKDYINTKTKEGQVAAEYIKLSESFGQQKLEQAIRQKSASEAEYLDMLKNSQINFLGTHIARNFTPHGKKQLRVGEARDRAMKSMIDEIALSEAYKKYGKDKVNKDLSLVENMKERAIGLAAIKFDDMLNFNASKLSIKHLKKRHSLQELYTADEKGKLQRTYEYKFDRTVKPYVWGMSKFYSTLEVFPEMVTFEGFRKPGVKKLLASLEMGEGKTRVMGRWIKETFLKQLGMENSSNPYDITYRSMETAARILAKTGLSFPTAGAKNLLAGQTQGLYAQKAYDWGRGMLKVFTTDAKQYNEALATNAFGVGNKIYEATSTTKIGNFGNMLSEIAFTFGFMKPTEKYNRLASIFAAKYDINRQVESLKNFKTGSKQYNKAVTRLKWYNVNEKDIKLLGKYGSKEGVEGYLNGYEKFKTQRELDNIHQIMNTAAHVKTQGSSADLFMPRWAGSRGAKPLTLFKRMAFAASSNTIKNTKQALKEKNIIKPLMGLTATYMTGQAMLGIYSNVLGTAMPKENSDWWTRFNTIMWKGEFMGILSDWMSPFDNTDSLNPAIWNSLGSILTSVDQLKDGKVTKSQAFDTIVKKNLSGYNNYIKIMEKTFNPLNRDRIRFGKLYGQYEEDVLENPNIVLESTTRTKYFKDLSSVFYNGNEKQFAKQLGLTFVAIAHDYYRTNRADSMEDAFKMADSSMQRKLKSMNPNKASLFKSSEKANKSSIKFLKWLKNHKESDVLIPRLFEIEKEYNDRLNLYMSKVPRYWKKLNIGSMLKDFKWEQKKF